MLFKDRLKELREDRHFSQKKVAISCDLTPTCICQLETGVRNPTGSTLVALANFFDVSIDYLMGRTTDIENVSLAMPGEQLTADERELLNGYRKLDLKNRMHVSAYLTVRLEEQESARRV